MLRLLIYKSVCQSLECGAHAWRQFVPVHGKEVQERAGLFISLWEPWFCRREGVSVSCLLSHNVSVQSWKDVMGFVEMGDRKYRFRAAVGFCGANQNKSRIPVFITR